MVIGNRRRHATRLVLRWSSSHEAQRRWLHDIAATAESAIASSHVQHMTSQFLDPGHASGGKFLVLRTEAPWRRDARCSSHSSLQPCILRRGIKSGHEVGDRRTGGRSLGFPCVVQGEGRFKRPCLRRRQGTRLEPDSPSLPEPRDACLGGCRTNGRR